MIRTFLALLLSSVPLPDVHQGVINGNAAMLVMPRLSGDVIDPTNCEAHLVSHFGTGPELTYRCGAWFQPPPGTYRLWLEKGDLITPSPDLLVWNGGPFTGKGLGDIVDVVPGGRVQLPQSVVVPDGSELQVVHVDSHYRLGLFGRAFERIVSSANAHNPILVPAGRVVPFIVDSHGQVTAIFRPVMVPERGTVTIPTRTETNTADVFVKIQRPRVASTANRDRITTALTLNGHDVAPSVFIATADRTYAFWYDVAPSRATLHIDSDTLAPVNEHMLLKAGAIVTVRKSLQLRPTVHVNIDAPAPLLTAPKRIDVSDATGTTIRHLDDVQGAQIDIGQLPLEQLRIRLSVPKWYFDQDVDVTNGQDATVTFALKPIIVTGTVYHGTRPTPAKVRFFVSPEWEEAATDDDGKYELTLWEARF